MEFEVSQKTEKLCKSLKLTPNQLVFADLISVGWEPADAYIAAYHQGATWTKAALKREVDKLMEYEFVKNRIDENHNVLSQRQKDSVVNTAKKEINNIVNSAMSKEQMLYDLQTAKAKQPVGSKEWIDINKMIIDVTRMKQDEVQTENNTIHHYLPVHYPTGCHDCLYQRCDTCKYKKAYNGED